MLRGRVGLALPDALQGLLALELLEGQAPGVGARLARRAVPLDLLICFFLRRERRRGVRGDARVDVVRGGRLLLDREPRRRLPTSSSANRAAAFVVRLAPGNETSQLATFGDAFALRRGDAWHLIAETFLTHSEPVAPALALRSRMQEAFSVTHALAPPRQVPPGGAEGWRLQHGEHLLLRDAADNLVASLALDKPKRESHDEI